MGNEIVRYADDKYVAWNTNVDGPEIWNANFDEMVEHCVFYDREKEEYARPEAIKRVTRARDTGTSQMWHAHKGDDEVYLYHQEGYLYLREMQAFLDSYDEASDEFDLTLLHPFEDDDDDTDG